MLCRPCSVGHESTGTSGLRLLAHFNIFLPSTCAEVKLLLLSTNSRRRGICPTLTSLYWLLINFGIVFKTSLMFKGLPGTAPCYISESHVPYEPGSESKGVTLVQGSVSEIPDSQCKAGDGRGFWKRCSFINTLQRNIESLYFCSSSLQRKLDWATWYDPVSWLSWTLPQQSELSVEDPCQWRSWDSGMNTVSLQTYVVQLVHWRYKHHRRSGNATLVNSSFHNKLGSYVEWWFIFDLLLSKCEGKWKSLQISFWFCYIWSKLAWTI